MKKFLGAIISGLAGVLSLVFLAIPAFTIDYGVINQKYSGWDLLTTKDIANDFKLMNKDSVVALNWYRIFAWVIVVVAVILIVLAVLQLLSSLNIIKMPAIIDTIAKYALIALAVASILALIANFGLRAEHIDVYKDLGAKGEALKRIKKAYDVGASLWIVSIINLIAAACANVFAKAKK